MHDIRIHAVNVLVIGAGGAGLRAAIAASEAGCEVLVVGKRARNDAHTVLAAGGINAVLGTRDPEDTWQQHFADTYKEGYGLGDPEMIEILVREAPRAVTELADWGAPFVRLPDGRLDQRYFGAHTYRRTCFAGDWTGRAMLQTLARRSEGIPLRERFYVTSLLVSDGVCFGAFGFDLDTGERTAIYADAVVLATGGHTRLWRRSSSRRDENTGDGMSLALRAGCTLADMELVQFHPTGMLTPEEAAGTLVTEAVRGEGGRLFNALGERFMANYDRERMELSTRDRVALACYTEIAAGRGGPHGGIFLDISHLDKALILERLPRMYRQFLEYQLLDISRTPMEVAPTAHYSMGGVVVDPSSTATGVAGLFAAGEVTAGVHGANRLGGNSLAETAVFGRRAGESAAAHARASESAARPRAVVARAGEEVAELIRSGAEFVRPMQRDLRDLMWERCGVVRDEDGLKHALIGIEELTARVREADVAPTSEGYDDLAHVLDLRGSLLVAEATVRGALARRETRGAHNRSDHPALDPALTLQITVSVDGLATRPAPPLAPELARIVEMTPDHEVDGRLLE
ncbi:FAD-dependent oxidoreductase [Nonomuraea sp. NPDC050556]|uniref:FAD-dependent oxidoreductase n=1 Tax=Nonomuraea sp. NPDC050556 TaxID=3364369 RepID=UPI00379A518D